MDHHNGPVIQASKDVTASHDVLLDIFERIEYFFKRLEAYTEVPQTAAMTDIIVKIMVEVLSIFAIATKEMKQGRGSTLFPSYTLVSSHRIHSEKFLKKLVGRRDIEDALQRLDRLTQEEARMATAEVLRLTQNVDDKVNGIGFQVEGVKKGVQGVDGKVEGVDERVKGVDHKVQAIDDRVKQVDDRVGVVNDNVKLIVDGARACFSVSTPSSHFGLARRERKKRSNPTDREHRRRYEPSVISQCHCHWPRSFTYIYR